MASIPEEFLEFKASILEGMIEYLEPMEDEEAEDSEHSYSPADVGRCGAILAAYLDSIFNPAIRGNKEKILAAVKDTVLALNKLNEECEFEIIETDQREDICELIITAAAEAGFDSNGEDITEEWREW